MRATPAWRPSLSRAPALRPRSWSQAPFGPLWRDTSAYRSGANMPSVSAAVAHRGDDPQLAAGAALRRGRELFATRHCANCHGMPARVAAGATAIPELSWRPPDLVGAGARLHPEWVAQWLLDPRSVDEQ